MKILIDINHPAHVHYFRNFIKIMEEKEHSFKVINRDSRMINQLLDYYKIKHVIRCKRPATRNVVGSILYIAKCIKICVKVSISFKPDVYIGFASAVCAITSSIFRKPCVVIDDTEHNTMNHRLYLPFCSVVLTPFYFNKSLGKKQLYFNAFVEQFYLHSKYFTPSDEILNDLKTVSREYVLVRYVANDAYHDLYVKAINTEIKQKFLLHLEGKIKFFLSLEENSKISFSEEYILKISPEKIHDVQANARFIISEGGTMSTEAFILGVPTICMNPLDSGSSQYQESHYSYRSIHCCNEKEIMEKIEYFFNLQIDSSEERYKLELDTIDPTSFLVWFIEKFPESKKYIISNPDFQFKFK